MKKILVFSDSHGNTKLMKQAVREHMPDMIIHLGDCWNDAMELRGSFLGIPMEAVPGNCDCVVEPAQRILLIEGKRIMICHGHTYNVKSSLLSIACAAQQEGADMVLFGHTHRAFYDWHNNLQMYNPGTIGAPRYGGNASYGVMTIDGRTKEIHVDTIHID